MPHGEHRADPTESYDTLIRAVAGIESVDPEAVLELAVGERICCRFRVLRQLGAGGMGVVYEAWDETLEQPVALKAARVASAGAMLRLREEFRALGAVRHPAIVKPIELFAMDEQHLVFAMELVQGQGLRDAVAAGRVSPRQVIAELADAVAALHASGLAHRDLKPSNVLVDRRGHVRLIDFGLTRNLLEPRFFDAARAGTPAYMPPESGGDPRAADLWALGTLGAELFTHRRLAPDERLDASDPVSAVLDALRHPEPSARLQAEEAARRLGASSRVATKIGFIGRREQRAALEHALDDQGVAFLHGPPGIGKTALIDELLQARCEVVLRGRCHEREELPYKGLDDVVDGLAGLLEAPPTAVPERALAVAAQAFAALSLVSGHGSAKGPRLDPEELVTALSTLLAALASRTPLLIVLDDYQWVDPDGRAVVEGLLRRRVSGVRYLLASRTPPAEPVAGALVLPLPPLGADEAEALARALGCSSAEPLGTLLDRAAGMPFAIVEWTRRIARHGDALDAGIVAALDALEGEPRLLLDMLLSAGGPIERRILRSALGISEVALERAADDLRRDDWAVEAGRTRLDMIHDLVRRSAAEALPPSVAREAHRRLAEAYAELAPHDHDHLAVHWLRSGARERARPHVVAAARAAEESFAYAHAASRYRLALEIAPRAPDAAELWLGLARSLAAGAESLSAARAFLEARARLGATAAGRAAERAAALQLLVGGAHREGMDALDTALRGIGLRPLPGSSEAVLLTLLVERMRLPLARLARPRPLDELGRDAIDLLLSGGVGLAFFDGPRGFALQTRALRLALRGDDPDRLARCEAAEAMAAGLIEGPSGVRAGLARAARAAARAPRSPRLDLALRACLVSKALAEGRFRRLVEIHDATRAELYDDLPELPTYEMDGGEFIRALALGLAGDLEGLSSATDAADRETARRGDRSLHLLMGALSRPLALLAEDRVADASSSILDTERNAPGDRVGLVYGLALVGHLSVALYEGRADAMLVALRSPERRRTLRNARAIGFVRQELDFVRANAALASRTGSVDRYVAKLRASKFPWGRALALLVEAQRDVRDGRDPAPRLRAARRAFVARGMRLHAWAAGRGLGDRDEALEASLVDPIRFLRIYAPVFAEP